VEEGDSSTHLGLGASVLGFFPGSPSWVAALFLVPPFPVSLSASAQTKIHDPVVSFMLRMDWIRSPERLAPLVLHWNTQAGRILKNHCKNSLILFQSELVQTPSYFREQANNSRAAQKIVHFSAVLEYIMTYLELYIRK
jgi:hypothetical protein